MSLSFEWKDRISLWAEKLKSQFYIPLGVIDMEAYLTFDQLNASQAMEHEFIPIPTGTKWGKKWQYGWFKGEIILPEEAQGKRIVLDIQTGGESAVYINGNIIGCRRADYISEPHHFISDLLLAESGKAGESYELLVETYAGHGARVCNAGPVTPGTVAPYEPGETQVELSSSTYGIWNETAYQLWLDAKMLLDVRNNIDQNSLRTAEIDKGLKDFAIIADFELPFGEMLETLKDCRKRLKPLLECKNGSTSPRMYVFGHSHIDIEWLWPLTETERKCARTFSTQLAQMEMYKGYIFLQSQPYIYSVAKRLYPEIYEKVKEKVKEGRFIPEGGMWVEADTNITSGESLIRQFIHGKRFFMDEFSKDNELLWLPDVFGYSAALPQIMKGCGIKYFSTHKIFWNYNGGDRFPYNYFMWQGVDGTEIISFLHEDYNSFTCAEDLIKRWDNRVQTDGIAEFLVPFGYGDGGGGPTRDHLENTIRLSDLEGVPRVEMTNPVDFFKSLESNNHLPENKYVGELYFQGHRGVYTSQARTKKGNRKSEYALREAEMWGSAAMAIAGFNYPLQEMNTQWKAVLLSQFHDNLAGSAIARVYEETEKSYCSVMQEAGKISDAAVAKFCKNEKALTIFNSLSWNRKAIVELPSDWHGARDYNGNEVLVQSFDGIKLAEVDVPSCGWTTLVTFECKQRDQITVNVGCKLLENEHLRVIFNNKGEITSMFDKDTGVELAAGVCNSMKMYKDVPRSYDAWDIDSMYELAPLPLDENAEISVSKMGTLVSSLEIKRKINNSTLVQNISLRRDSRRLDFETMIDWRESHKLIKVCFPVNIHTDEALHEIQFGYVKRPNHRSREYDADRFEVCNHKWSALVEENRGAAILNDCKYGVNVLGNSINLTLLKAPKAPDFNADVGIQKFTYSFYAWNGPLIQSNVIREAYELNIPAKCVAGSGGINSLFRTNDANIIIDTVKPAEDGSGDVIVRLFESIHTSSRCTLSIALPIKKAVQTNMLEIPESDLSVDNGDIYLDFRPFEIKTLRLYLSGK